MTRRQSDCRTRQLAPGLRLSRELSRRINVNHPSRTSLANARPGRQSLGATIADPGRQRTRQTSARPPRRPLAIPQGPAPHDSPHGRPLGARPPSSRRPTASRRGHDTPGSDKLLHGVTRASSTACGSGPTRAIHNPRGAVHTRSRTHIRPDAHAPGDHGDSGRREPRSHPPQAVHTLHRHVHRRETRHPQHNT